VTRNCLQQSNRLLIAALESARDGIAISDLQGTILHVNRALERLTGYTRTELEGHDQRLLRSDRTPPERDEEMRRTILGRTSWQGELPLRRKDGSLVDVSLTASPIVDPQGRLTHFVAIHRDVTDRKLLERQLLQAQKMQSVGTLAGGVAHEFNNLLAGINGYAALGLRETQVPESVRQFLQHIVDLSERAATLTRQLLAFARKPALAPRPTRMRELLENTARLVTHTLHVDVHCDSEPATADDLFTEADANQLQQALINLALNARDAMPTPAPIIFRLRRVVLAASRSAFPEDVPAGDYVHVGVEDRGSGMPPEVLSQALDPFFTTKDVGQGTGLGLPMVFGIVRGHQGYLTLDSEVGRGTCVGIYLPRLANTARGREAAEFKAGHILEPEAVSGRNILVIDDEEAVRDVVRRFLEIAGHQVTCAASGNEALALLARGWPTDLIILDLMMPREDGLGTLCRLRQQRPETPVLLCTGLLGSEPPPEIATSPTISFLRKPFRMNELWYAVNHALPTEPAVIC
jgi:PAS domain S-box-containing protein